MDKGTKLPYVQGKTDINSRRTWKYVLRMINPASRLFIRKKYTHFAALDCLDAGSVVSFCVTVIL